VGRQGRQPQHPLLLGVDQHRRNEETTTHGETNELGKAYKKREKPFECAPSCDFRWYNKGGTFFWWLLTSTDCSDGAGTHRYQLLCLITAVMVLLGGVGIAGELTLQGPFWPNWPRGRRDPTQRRKRSKAAWPWALALGAPPSCPRAHASLRPSLSPSLPCSVPPCHLPCTPTSLGPSVKQEVLSNGSTERTPLIGGPTRGGSGRKMLAAVTTPGAPASLTRGRSTVDELEATSLAAVTRGPSSNPDHSGDELEGEGEGLGRDLDPAKAARQRCCCFRLPRPADDQVLLNFKSSKQGQPVSQSP
jgi:hypothetical protein